MKTDLLKSCWFVAGPTAVGKTALSLRLAEQINAEIISMDSMAVYRHMDVGTAKPSAEERQAVRHHLIDVVDPHCEFSVTEYVQLAEAAVADIIGRKKIPLFVGGTGLYLRSLLRGVFQGPEADWDLRQQLETTRQQFGNVWLHQQLREVDPHTAERLHENDTRRIIRAIEVFRLTGRAMSEQHNEAPLPPESRPTAVFWLEPPREWLYDRINRRVDNMMKAGLLQETQRLLNRNPPPGRTARQALGYRELITHIEDAVPLSRAVELICTRTRQFAKRQHTWFRNMEECRSLKLDGTETAEQLADRIKQAAGI